MRTSKKMKAAIAMLALVGATGLSSCGGNDSSTDTTAAATESTVAGHIAFDGMWARTSAAGAMMGAAYLTITSPVDDALLGVTVDPTVAAMAQVHEVVAAMPTGSTGMTMAPEMKMQQVDRIDLPAGTAVALKPGGYHIMLMQLAVPLETGAKISITLTFEKAGEKVVEFPVMEDAPAGS